jgi:trans-L-3-hydroxyproline dehydratase
MLTIRTIDAHTAGEPLRLIVDGFPRVEGRTLLEKREWVKENHDHLRRALMLEPRGHADMYGALLTEPEHDGSDAGVLFMHNEGYSTMCGHGVIAVVTIALERGLLMPRAGRREIVLDAPAGPIRATATMLEADSGKREAGGARRRLSRDEHQRQAMARPRRSARSCGRARRRGKLEAPRVSSVSFRNVPSFVLHGGVPVRLGSRSLRADIAYGGAFYAVVDSEAAGLAIVPERLPELRRVGMQIKHSIEASLRVVHPDEPGLHGVYGTIFTGPPSDEQADLRNVTVFADAEVDRSPCGTGTCAVMAVLAAMGLLGPGQIFTHESIIGTTFRGRVAAETAVGDRPAIVPEIEGEAYITGENIFLMDERDPLRFGFRL